MMQKIMYYPCRSKKKILAKMLLKFNIVIKGPFETHPPTLRLCSLNLYKIHKKYKFFY